MTAIFKMTHFLVLIDILPEAYPCVTTSQKLERRKGGAISCLPLAPV